MAHIRIRNTEQRLESEQEVRAFLQEQGVLYEHWNPEKLPENLRDYYTLTEEEKAEILQVYDEEIRSLAQRNGYEKWDIVALSDATPNLDELLKKFENVHIHTEDEVRAITAGNGIFTIKGGDEIGYFDVELSAGDVISVPVNTPHFFTLMENRKVVAVRLFIDPAGWVAHPYEDPTFKKTS
ncbi:1,2-dihydroxy-3-keto-5-methylthiopentene dioxygenase [Desmospora activa]|uniref:Acireductone dioxygenase n=1 Tax=Desmospora activa DSM 45169 TaxID=1121389 RepID=A0A2T4Z1R5_9BACL|nr:cupin domain-containing protein [Desmospora activa]PTM54691.1 acireductone dioxygenase apoprotein [Desmospora activa DSM 45169]